LKLGLTLLLLGASLLLADGGAILLRKHAGPLLITAFGMPRVGPSEISVLVQDRNFNPVLDADIEIAVGYSVVHAVHGPNKLLYTAIVELPCAGKIPIIIKSGEFEVTGEIEVEPQTPPLVAYWPYFAVVPVIVALFALNQWLKSKRRVRRLAARP
jgi:hypothetical protein